MWFKRRKKSEQDHALSESLRSLQSLLSETGRREPSLDPRGMPADEAEAEAKAAAGARPGVRQAHAGPRAGTRDASPPETRQPDAPPDEPTAPGDSGTRWRDLNLSFDAEPVLPRARRDEAPAPERDAAPEPPGAPGTKPGAPEMPVPEPEHGPADDDAAVEAPPGADDAADTEAPAAPAADAEPQLPAAEPEPEPRLDDEPAVAGTAEPDVVTYDPAAAGPASGAGPVDELGEEAVRSEPIRGASGMPSTGDEDDDSGYGFRSRSDEEVLVLDLEAPAAAAGAGAELEQEEDQLHLELESDDASEADIPVLTNAVYVPETPPQQPAPPDPAGSPREASIGRFIDDFRVRLQLMGLEALSAAQEKELHEALVEFLDELKHD